MNMENQNGLPQVHGKASKRGRGRPAKETECDGSEERRNSLEIVFSQLDEANALLMDESGFPGRKRVERAQRLFQLIAVELDLILAPDPDIVSPFEGFDIFVNGCVVFVEDARESIKTLHEAYLECNGFDDADFESGEAYTRIRFTRTMLAKYGDKISVSVQRVNGGAPQRCFIGLRLKDLEESPEAENG
jgi:hypothetical protein